MLPARAPFWCDRILWRIEPGDGVLAGSEDDRPVMESPIQQINGRSLLSGHDSILEFTDHLVLKTFVTTSQEDARWHFRHRAAMQHSSSRATSS